MDDRRQPGAPEIEPLDVQSEKSPRPCHRGLDTGASAQSKPEEAVSPGRGRHVQDAAEGCLGENDAGRQPDGEVENPIAVEVRDSAHDGDVGHFSKVSRQERIDLSL